jgi:hypothetical protein
MNDAVNFFRTRRRAFAIGATLAFVPAPFAASAAGPSATLAGKTVYHFYVATTGSDTNPGTEALPFKTIERAAASASPSTTVHVAPGAYAGGIKTTASGTASARIYFISTFRGGARIVPPDDSKSAIAWDNRGNYVDIAGFEVDGSVYKGGAKWSNGIYSGGSYVVVRENHVHDIARTVTCTAAGGSAIGLDSYYKGVNSEAIGNLIHDIGPPGCRYVQGIYISTPGAVKNNVVYRVAEAAIHLWHDANRVVIVNNTVAMSHTGIIVGAGDFYYTKGPNDFTKVYNNIVYDNNTGISEQGSTGKHNSYRNNLVFQNRAANWELRNGLQHSGTVAQDPQFVGYRKTGKPDFHLSRNSPAINAATALEAYGVDAAGRPRNEDSGYDIGAFQY